MEEQDKRRTSCVSCKGKGFEIQGVAGPRLRCPHCNPCETCGGYAPWGLEVAASLPLCGCEQYFWNPEPEVDRPNGEGASMNSQIDAHPKSEAIEDGVPIDASAGARKACFDGGRAFDGVRRPFADATLIDVTEVSRSVGFVDPFAITEEAYLECVKRPADAAGQSERLRLWKVFCAMHSAISSGANRRAGDDKRVFRFFMNVPINDGEEVEQVHLKAFCGPGRWVVLTTTHADEV